MYHEIQRGSAPTCRADAKYMHFVVREQEFQRQLRRLVELEYRGVSVGASLTSFPRQGIVAITFDDGCASDLTVAAPLLQQYGLGATFYITTGFLDQAGFLSSLEARELSERGFEIGCHGATHCDLTRITSRQLDAEVGASKDGLEQIIGRRVEHFSAPGGRWNARLISAVRNAGFRSLATSDIGTNGGSAFLLCRLPVLRTTRLPEFADLCLGHGLRLRRAARAAARVAKGVVGTDLYDRLRSSLRRREDADA